MKYCLYLISFLMLAGTMKADDETFADMSKMKYVTSFDEAKGISRRTGKPIFINFYAKWAGPCQGMDKLVFSDEQFAKYMDDKFVNYIIDVKTPEGKEMVKKYGVDSYAYYAVVDCNGEVIQPIGRGAPLPDFKEDVSIALSPKTSWASTKAKYETGNYSKKDLRNYINSLRVAGIGKELRKRINEYMGMLSPKEYLKKENWDILFYERSRNNSFYRYVVENKPAFINKFGENKVNKFLTKSFALDVFNNATRDVDLAVIDAIDAELKAAVLPDTANIVIVHNIGKLRANRRYVDMFKYMDEYGHYLESEPMLRQSIERSFYFNSLKGDDKEALVDYLQRAIKRESKGNAAKLQDLLVSIQESPKGIVFEENPMADVLAKAKKENKLVFVDCYTSWCGPCRNLATNVFTRDEVGKYFNEKFVNTKVDMEKGEGPELSKKYGVSAFPTMLILDHDGNEAGRVVGFRASDELIDAVEKVVNNR